MNFDTAFMLTIKEMLRISPAYDVLVYFAAFFLIWILLVLMFFMTVDGCRNWKHCKLVFLGVLGSAGVGYVLNLIFETLIYYRPRPYIALDYIPLIDGMMMNASFPSNHATIAFALVVSWMVYFKRFSGLLLVVAFIIAIARVFAGVHYPTDVLAGAVWGSVVGTVCMLYYKKKLTL